jgi:hypothetical protein
MATQVEELPDNKVRLTVDVPRADVHHAVEHAASDLASSVKIPGFRKGKVPMPVLRSHIGKERLLSEAIESHISGWFWNAAARERIRPVEQPELDYELPDSEDTDWRFTATVSVLPKPEVADWTKVQVPYVEPEVPEDFVDHELNVLRSTVAELKPAEGRPAEAGDTIVTNRQLVHGSFANSSPDRRLTLNAGFFPRKRVLNVTTRRLNGVVETYGQARIDARTRIIQIAIDARRQRFPQETAYIYRPLAGREDENRWNETTRATVLKNYNQLDMFIRPCRAFRVRPPARAWPLI